MIQSLVYCKGCEEYEGHDVNRIKKVIVGVRNSRWDGYDEYDECDRSEKVTSPLGSGIPDITEWSEHPKLLEKILACGRCSLSVGAVLLVSIRDWPVCSCACTGLQQDGCFNGDMAKYH
jgi:hypothetical protein